MPDSGVAESTQIDHEVIKYLRITGDYAPAESEVQARMATVQEARAVGIRVSDSELQRVVDAWRLANKLSKASDTEAWLRAVGVTLDDLEEHLEANVLISKFKDHLEKNTPTRKYLRSAEIKQAIRLKIYREWLSSKMSV